jgi:MATE family multidrug resistance protein
LAFNVNSLLFLPMLGFGTAVMTLVGKRIGAGCPQTAVRTTWIALAFTTAYMCVWAAILVLVPGIVLAPYAARSNPAEFAAIQPTIVVLLQFIAAYTLFDGMNIVFASAIRGAGDTRFCLLFTFFSSLSLMVIPTYLVLRVFDMGLYAAWACVMVYIVFLSFGFLLRFLTGQWKSMSVINEAPAEVPAEPRWEWDIPDPEPVSVAAK